MIGAAVAGWFYIREIRAAIPSHIAMIESAQEQRCMLSLAVLTRLEAGDTQYAKSMLAREVADFHHHHSSGAEAPQKQKILDLIEATKTKSAALREELGKTSQGDF